MSYRRPPSVAKQLRSCPLEFQECWIGAPLGPRSLVAKSPFPGPCQACREPCDPPGPATLHVGIPLFSGFLQDYGLALPALPWLGCRSPCDCQLLVWPKAKVSSFRPR